MEVQLDLIPLASPHSHYTASTGHRCSLGRRPVGKHLERPSNRLESWRMALS